MNNQKKQQQNRVNERKNAMRFHGDDCSSSKTVQRERVIMSDIFEVIILFFLMMIT
jgi:hypothetical protein